MSFNFTSVCARASQLSFDSTVKNCINKSIRCWVCLLLLRVLVPLLLLLLLLQCHSRIHFIWFHYEHFSAFVDIEEAKRERERKASVCSEWADKGGGHDALLFITFHTRICVCVCARVYTIKHWCQNLICCINRFEPLTHSCVRFIFVETATAKRI